MKKFLCSNPFKLKNFQKRKRKNMQVKAGKRREQEINERKKKRNS